MLPLAIEQPDVRFVGMDARKKKITAIQEMINEYKTDPLELKNVHLLWARVEEYKGVKFDVVLARAVAHVDILIPWMLAIVKKGGTLVLYKEYKEEEKKVLVDLCVQKKLTIEKEYRYVLEGSGPAASDGVNVERVIYVIEFSGK